MIKMDIEITLQFVGLIFYANFRLWLLLIMLVSRTGADSKFRF
jgi:hypothetical protein